MFANAKLSERLAVAGAIDPDAYTANSYLSGEIDAGLYEQLMFVGLAGTLGSSGTLTFAVHGAAAAGGSYAAITAKANAALTQAGTDADKQVIINLRGADLLAQARRFVKHSMIVGVQTSDCGAIVLGELKQGGAGHLNSLMSERYAVVGVVDPDANAPGDFDSDVVDMGKWGQACAFAMAGDIDSESTIAGAWFQATSAAKAGEKAIAGATHTLLEGAAGSNAQVAVNIRAEDLDIEGGFRYAYFRQTVADVDSPPATPTSDSAVVVIAGDPRDGAASANDLASVDEIVS
jgi:hypothetical protein